MASLAEKIATITPAEVDEEELNTLDLHLRVLADAFASGRRKGDLIEFLTGLSKSLRHGEAVALYTTTP